LLLSGLPDLADALLINRIGGPLLTVVVVESIVIPPRRMDHGKVGEMGGTLGWLSRSRLLGGDEGRAGTERDAERVERHRQGERQEHH
jgi:hypothetical protein